MPKREHAWIIRERVNVISLSDLAYIAGFIDGEGTLTIRRSVKYKTKNVYYQAYAVINNTYEPTMRWLHGLLGGSLRQIKQYSKSKTVRHKDIFTLTIEPRMLRVLLPKILPYLKEKKQHAEILLMFLKTKVYGYGRPIPSYVIDQREKLIQQIRSLNERTATLI